MNKLVLFTLILSFSTLCTAVKTTNLLIFPHQGKTLARSTIVRGLNMAKRTIRIASPILTDPSLIAALKDKAKKNIAIHILLNNSPLNKEILRLSKHKNINCHVIQSKDGSGVSGLGATYIIVDDHLLIVSGVSLDEHNLRLAKGFGYIVHNAPIVADTLRMFHLDWAKKVVRPKGGPVIWGPDNTRSQVLSYFKQAQNTIHIMTPPLLDEGLTLALCQMAQSGITIKLLMPPFSGKRKSNHKKNAIMLRKSGVDLHYLTGNPAIEGTYIAIDKTHLLILSTALNPHQLNTNREFGIISKSNLSIIQFLKTFNKHWKEARPRV